MDLQGAYGSAAAEARGNKSEGEEDDAGGNGAAAAEGAAEDGGGAVVPRASRKRPRGGNPAAQFGAAEVGGASCRVQPAGDPGYCLALTLEHVKGPSICHHLCAHKLQ